MQQMREAFPWDRLCRYLLRDRDAIYGGDWVAMTKGLGMEEVISSGHPLRGGCVSLKLVQSALCGQGGILIPVHPS